MPTFEQGQSQLYYESVGEGFPVLVFAPGGMRSCIPMWQRASYDPMARLSPHFRVIALDQRNASRRSPGPVTANDGWHSFTQDHVALLDHLGIERCHVLGNCIGGTFSLGLIRRAPERVCAAVLQQPIGHDGDNRQLFQDMFDGWANELGPKKPEVTAAAWAGFRDNLYGDDDFIFDHDVSREFVSGCATPMLVLMGNDPYHPSKTSREIARLAPNAELIEQWKEAEVVDAAVERVIAFLQRHTPV